MFKLIIFACVLSVGFGRELYTTYYTPGLGYYAPSVAYTRAAAAIASPAVVPLAYARLHTPGSAAVHTYNSVETPNSFQQQYRSDYKPVAYEYVY